MAGKRITSKLCAGNAALSKHHQLIKALALLLQDKVWLLA